MVLLLPRISRLGVHVHTEHVDERVARIVRRRRIDRVPGIEPRIRREHPQDVVEVLDVILAGVEAVPHFFPERLQIGGSVFPPPDERPWRVHLVQRAEDHGHAVHVERVEQRAEIFDARKERGPNRGIFRVNDAGEIAPAAWEVVTDRDDPAAVGVLLDQVDGLLKMKGILTVAKVGAEDRRNLSDCVEHVLIWRDGRRLTSVGPLPVQAVLAGERPQAGDGVEVLEESLSFRPRAGIGWLGSHQALSGTDNAIQRFPRNTSWSVLVTPKSTIQLSRDSSGTPRTGSATISFTYEYGLLWFRSAGFCFLIFTSLFLRLSNRTISCC